MIVGLFPIVLARVVLEIVSSMAGLVIVVTGLLAGAFRTFAVLTGSSTERVERLTALGFAGGIVIAFGILLLDGLVG